ncbi:MAG: S46 family peptidase [Alphaproteobacteria bacterium]|nr:S46 family peptidase [Alphaproteobacteria bacterium]
MRWNIVLAALVWIAPAALADEGMWTIDNFPAAKVKAVHGWAPDKAWLDRVQKASVRLDGGCSGAVVSKTGLVLTNHHCISDCAEALSSPSNDLLSNGFLSADLREERVCPGAEASILQSVSDVTKRVKDATRGVPAAEIAGRRGALLAAIEKETCGENRKKRCEVVSLHRGGQYNLYVYDRYQDVRLAFAPERQAAFFGGDPDNFNFPRYAFDISLVRLYRNGEPAEFKVPLAIDPDGAATGELVFTSGHPGWTERLLTVAQLEFQRDHFLPWRIEYASQLRGSLLTQAGKGEEEARQAEEALFGVENTVKVIKGQRGALVEPAFFGLKVAEEKKLREALASDSALRARFGNPFADIEKVIPAQKSAFLGYQMLEVRLGAGSVLLADARALVRAAAERDKPDAERLTEYGPSRLATLERTLLAESPVHPTLEQLQIEFWLLKTREYLGADHPAVAALFGPRAAAEIARELVVATRLDDPAYRKRLWENSGETAASNDPAIALYRLIDAAARKAREAYETSVSGPLSIASEKVAGLRFAVLGDAIAPDATFTLRLSYGTVQGWTDPVLGPVGPFTYARGLWKRATGAWPFTVASKWSTAASRIDPDLPMNLVSSNDIIGGNSGSPLLDRQGRIVGLVFDGNIHSLGGAYGFDPALNRTVSVASPMLLEGLRKVYGATVLADEMQGR